MKRHLPLGAFCILCSCTTNTIHDKRVETGSKSVPQADEDTILVRTWSFRDDRVYIDRNGDGIVDWFESGSARYTDGYGVFKEDTDYDGYFDRQFKAGGFEYSVIEDLVIRERVPQIHRAYKPTKITRKPRPGSKPSTP
jgi:hypothetical protein